MYCVCYRFSAASVSPVSQWHLEKTCFYPTLILSLHAEFVSLDHLVRDALAVAIETHLKMHRCWWEERVNEGEFRVVWKWVQVWACILFSSFLTTHQLIIIIICATSEAWFWDANHCLTVGIWSKTLVKSLYMNIHHGTCVVTIGLFVET